MPNSKTFKRLKLRERIMSAVTITAALCAVINAETPGQHIPRANRRFQHRMVWEQRLNSLTDRQFQRRYRIDKGGFAAILEKIKPHMPPRHRKSGVPNELKLSMTLRWLAGGSYLDISDLHGVHPATMYRHVWQTMRAIDKAYHFQLSPSAGGAITSAGVMSCVRHCVSMGGSGPSARRTSPPVSGAATPARSPAMAWVRLWEHPTSALAPL